MKIKTIKSIKNYGIFSDYSDSSLKNFGDSNIIFGWNYSGKTTLSRIFRSLELKRKQKSYESGKFKILLQNDSELTEADIETIELFETEGCKHLTGGHIHKEMADVLYKNHKKGLSA